MPNIYVEIAVILAGLLTQVIGFAVWFGRFSTSVKMRLKHLEDWQEKNDRLNERIVRIEATVNDMSKNVDRILRTLDEK